MKTYEITYIISPAISQEQIAQTIKNIESFVVGREGLILRSEKTQAQVLAYPIKKQSSGYFTTLEIKISEDHINALKEKIEKDGNILRHAILIKKPLKAKERRMRRSFAVPEYHAKEAVTQAQTPFQKDAQKEKIELDDIDKKLDEILNE